MIKAVINTLTARLLALLILVFAISLAMVYWIIDQRAKPEVTKLASTTVIETGNEAVNGIMAMFNHVDGIATTASHVIGGMPKQAELINDSFGHLIQHTDKHISGGGVWYDPSMFQAGVEERAFVWERDKAGAMQLDPEYTALNPTVTLTAVHISTPNMPAKAAIGTADKQAQPTLASPYYRDWWYVPAMYANHDHCVWSRAYINAVTHIPTMTCAKAIFNAKTNGFEGVVSLDILLNQLQQTAADWQKKTGGYVFLVDMNNNFLTFPKENMVKQITATNPQGEMMTVANFAKQNPSFQPIATSLQRINQNLINKAKQIDNGKFELASNTIVSGTNLQRTTQDEAQIISALLLTNGQEDIDLNRNHFVEQVNIDEDTLLHKPATAFIFAMPFTNWKLVVVKPDSELLAFANHLGKQLQWYMLLGFIPVLLLSAYMFRHAFVSPMRRVASEVREMGELIKQKRYLALQSHKLPVTQVREIGVISEAMNQLVDRVVENEGALAQVNERLEQQVVERTDHLNQALKDLKASQVQLVQAEKMSTLGQMVAGVAHEVNTPLGYVSSNLELIDDSIHRYDELIATTQQLKQSLPAGEHDPQALETLLQQTINCSDELVADAISEDLHELINDSRFGVSQISELVVNLRDFSRLDQAKVKEVNLNDCIKSSLLMAKNNLKYLEVKTELADLPEISCNPSQINQVLLNLINNAAQAMPKDQSGVLTIKSFADDSNVYIGVVDNGSGIPSDVLANIFEPFFTTKPAGEGTGLGLAISAQIMQQHHGDISVDSTVGQGTSFMLRLPRTSHSNQAAKLAIANA